MYMIVFRVETSGHNNRMTALGIFEEDPTLDQQTAQGSKTLFLDKIDLRRGI